MSLPFKPCQQHTVTGKFTGLNVNIHVNAERNTSNTKVLLTTDIGVRGTIQGMTGNKSRNPSQDMDDTLKQADSCLTLTRYLHTQPCVVYHTQHAKFGPVWASSPSHYRKLFGYANQDSS